MKHGLFVLTFLLVCSSLVYGQGYDTYAHLSQWKSTSPQPGDTVIAKARNVTPLILDTTTCAHLANAVGYYDGGYDFQKEYDTGKYYIEQCYYLSNSWGAFPFVNSSGIGLEAKGDTIWAQAREWLKSVLYLNPDSLYYCSDLQTYAGTFERRDELGHPADYKTSLAILTYLADSSYCSGIKGVLKYYWNTYHYFWKDTVTDSLKTPFDTTLPNIDQAGQSFLRGFSRGVQNSDGTVSNDPFADLRATENPFKQELDLNYTVMRPLVAKIEVYDALGRQMYTQGQGYLDVGEHNLKISTPQWASGTYYARLVTLQGQVKTVKIIKE